MDLQPCRLDPEMYIESIGALVSSRLQCKEQSVRVVERFRKFG